MKKSESIQTALRQHSEGTPRAREQSDFVIPSEHKILCLVSWQKHFTPPLHNCIHPCRQDVENNQMYILLAQTGHHQMLMQFS